MTERLPSTSVGGGYNNHYPQKSETDLSPRKTMLILVIVVGCFAVLWPKVFYPMLVGSANQHIKPSPIDRTTGCCDVISETDVNTIKIMSELCGTIIKSNEDKPLSGREIVQKCRREILDTCGIDISIVLQEQVRLGQTVKQILDEIRSLNGSLCLKYNYGLAPWKLGVPHRVTVRVASDGSNMRQERPLNLRSELIHPAFRERGRAIPQVQAATPSRPSPRVIEGRPGPIPGMRPTLGGAGHVVPPSKQGTSSMSVIMPIYTIGIVIFFTYTLMRIIFKKQPESVGGSLYPPVDPDLHFRKEVFESESSRLSARLTRENISSKLVVNAMSALLDEVDQEIEARRKNNEVTSQDLVNGTLSNGDVVKSQDTEEQPSVKVLGMEMTASCEGGKKWSRPDSPVLPASPPLPPLDPVPPPQEIYLEGALPAQSQLLVSDSATEPQPATGEDPAVVLSGKMTLSVISLDSENGTDEAESVEKQIDQVRDKINDQIDEPDLEFEEYVLEPIIIKKFEASPISNIKVEDLEKQLHDIYQTASISSEQVEELVQKPLIQVENENTPQSIKVEELEKEVDELIQAAIDNIEHKESTGLENLPTNEINDSLRNVQMQIDNRNQESEINNQPLASLETKDLRQKVGELDVEKAMKIEELNNSTCSVSNQGANELHDQINTANGKTEEENSRKSYEEEAKQTDPVDVLITDDEELGSDEEIVEEIEEIEYESSEEESAESEDVEEVAITNTNANTTQRDCEDKSNLEKFKHSLDNGAENDISDEELIDNEDEDEEIIEIEEVEDDEDEEILEDNNLNHVSGESGQEL